MSQATAGPTSQNDLLADLQVDLRERRPAPAPVVPAAEPPRGPVLELRVTPLHWTAPGLAALPGGAGFELHAGPWRLAVTLHG